MRINYLKMAFERISRLYEGSTVVPVNKAQSPRCKLFGY
ncbi:hypothetical protein CU024_2715 [Enterococcus faecium]|nr:hypothetical protein [Enterococcus faecium]MBK4759200.1 hypothetical protein [Enterococcus faecium]MBK4761946.1 hypothetical protein [Enterococcus faecium]MBK4794473.1 hypothetical protein [Enterococcus faecium]MBK4805206.1 hypothetical protein [Enterococcus faecium]